MPMNPDGKSYTMNVGDPADIRDTLDKAEWGSITVNGVNFIVCPSCLAMMVPAFTNAHEVPSHRTPKWAHIEWHATLAEMFQDAKRR